MPNDATEAKDSRKVIEGFVLDCSIRVMAFRKTLTSESDRGAALMGAAFLDVELRSLLEFFLVGDRKILGRYFDYNGPGGSFSGRIDTAFLLGLITKSDHKDLTLIRKIRNEFAHVHEVLGFGTPAIEARCRELSWCGDEVEGCARAKYTRSVLAISASVFSAYLARPIFVERPVSTSSPDEDTLMNIRDDLFQDILNGKVDYSNTPELAKRMTEDAKRHRSTDSDGV